MEATRHQREALVRVFAEALTKNVAGYIAAIHDQRGNDILNPHAHIVAFDVQVKSGGRGRPRSTIGMARKNAIEETTALWAQTHNRLMQSWGYGPESRISHKSFAERGIDRLAEIHEGAASRQMHLNGKTPTPKADWHHIDSGHTRAETNAIIRELNSLKQEAMHDQTDPPYRLGNYYEDDRSKRTDRSEDDRAGGGSPLRGTGRPAPPWAAVVEVGSDDDGSERATNAGAMPPFLTANPASKTASTYPADRSVHSWSGVRRIYRELKMLRDTLHERILGKREDLRSPPCTQHITSKTRSSKRRRER